MRLIDADALCMKLQHLAAKDWCKRVAPRSWSHAYDAIRDNIENEPTVDAEPIRHGRWKNCVDYKKIDDVIYYGYTICSVCEKLQQYGYKTKFCPNCGAKMDGGDGNV